LNPAEEVRLKVFPPFNPVVEPEEIETELKVTVSY
jgi:hypothetical protein